MREKKITQVIMIWFLPLIVFGGLFLPLVGCLVLFMMIFPYTFLFLLDGQRSQKPLLMMFQEQKKLNYSTFFIWETRVY